MLFMRPRIPALLFSSTQVFSSFSSLFSTFFFFLLLYCESEVPSMLIWKNKDNNYNDNNNNDKIDDMLANTWNNNKYIWNFSCWYNCLDLSSQKQSFTGNLLYFWVLPYQVELYECSIFSSFHIAEVLVSWGFLGVKNSLHFFLQSLDLVLFPSRLTIDIFLNKNFIFHICSCCCYV